MSTGVALLTCTCTCTHAPEGSSRAPMRRSKWLPEEGPAGAGCGMWGVDSAFISAYSLCRWCWLWGRPWRAGVAARGSLALGWPAQGAGAAWPYALARGARGWRLCAAHRKGKGCVSASACARGHARQPDNSRAAQRRPSSMRCAGALEGNKSGQRSITGPVNSPHTIGCHPRLITCPLAHVHRRGTANPREHSPPKASASCYTAGMMQREPLFTNSEVIHRLCLSLLQSTPPLPISSQCPRLQATHPSPPPPDP